MVCLCWQKWSFSWSRAEQMHFNLFSLCANTVDSFLQVHHYFNGNLISIQCCNLTCCLVFPQCLNAYVWQKTELMFFYMLGAIKVLHSDTFFIVLHTVWLSVIFFRLHQLNNVMYTSPHTHTHTVSVSYTHLDVYKRQYYD